MGGVDSFVASCRLYGDLYRAGKISYHDAVDYLAVVADIAGIPYPTAAPLIAEALRDCTDDH